MHSPVAGLDNVRNNKVITVRYRDPTYAKDFVFLARKLPGAEEPPRVLKPGDYVPDSGRGRGRGRGGSGFGHDRYRPVIGFNPNMPKASLDVSGHRAIR